MGDAKAWHLPDWTGRPEAWHDPYHSPSLTGLRSERQIKALTGIRVAATGTPKGTRLCFGACRPPLQRFHNPTYLSNLKTDDLAAADSRSQSS